MRTVRARRLENKTDYKARFSLLKSELPRFVVRKTNRYIIVQLVKSDIAQDRVIFTLNSKSLLKSGWSKEKVGSLKSLVAAYIIGIKAGEEALKHKIHDAIFDIGMYRNIHKSRIYSVLKGALDAGLKIKHSPEVLPSIEQLKKNSSLAEILSKLTKIKPEAK